MLPRLSPIRLHDTPPSELRNRNGDALGKEWEQLMWRFQQPLPWAAAGQKWVPMERIFELEIEG